MNITFEQYQAARAEASAAMRDLEALPFDAEHPHPDESVISARLRAAKAVCDAWWEQPDPAAEAHNARMQALGDAE